MMLWAGLASLGQAGLNSDPHIHFSIILDGLNIHKGTENINCPNHRHTKVDLKGKQYTCMVDSLSKLFLSQF